MAVSAVSFVTCTRASFAKEIDYAKLLACLDRSFRPGEVLEGSLPFRNQNLPLSFVITRFKNFSKVTRADNVKFINEALEAKPGRVVFDGELSVIKELNDKLIKDKIRVTALVNYHKELLWDEIQKNPKLAAAIQAQYSDFKSVRFILDEAAHPGVVDDLSKAMEDANSQFYYAIMSNPQLSTAIREGRGIAMDPKNWFRGAVGRTLDEAAITNRTGRADFSMQSALNANPIRRFNDYEQRILKSFEDIEKLRGELKPLLDRHPALKQLLYADAGGQNQFGVSDDVIDVLRKLKSQGGDRDYPEYLALVQKKIAERTGANIGPKEAEKILRYYQKVDSFSPTILVEERIDLDLSLSESDLIAFDFVGQGVRNHRELQQKLLAAHLSGGGEGARVLKLQEALKLARESEKQSTEYMNRLKKWLEEAIVTAGEKPGRFLISGDDGLLMLPAERSPEWKQGFFEILWEKNKSGFGNEFRISPVPKKFADGTIIPDEARSKLITVAEGMEKDLRGKLVLALPTDKFRELGVAVEVIPQSEKGLSRVRLYTFPKGKVTQETRTLVERELRTLLPSGWDLL